MRKKILIMTASGILLLLFDIALSVPIGAEDIPFDGVLYVLFGYQETLYDQLIRDVRLLRVLSVLLTGGLPIASGVMMQGILYSPIAEPSVPGIMQGLVVLVATVPTLPLLTVAGSFWTVLAGASFGGLLVFLFAAKYAGHPDASRILPVDSALSIFFLSMVSPSAPMQSRSQELTFWIIGGPWQADWGVVISLRIVTFVCMDSFLLLSGKIDLLSLDDEAVISLGIDAAGLKKKVILMMIPPCIMCVAVVDNIGLAGLFAPRVLRNVPSRDICHILPLSFLSEGVLMVFSNIVARTLSAPHELSIGPSTTLLGIPAFLLPAREECG